MLRTRPRLRIARLAGAVVSLGLAHLAFESDARADEQLLVRDTNDHPRYTFDAEPHGLVGYGRFVHNLVPGVGFRGTVIIVQNGFIEKLNNSVGIGFGADFFFNRGGGAFVIPAVMQWNFWLSTHWAVFGEPGVALAFGGPATVEPVFAVGGRYHFNERVALTLRIGYPAASCGVSFYL